MEENLMNNTDLKEEISEQHLNLFHSLPENKEKKEIENKKELIINNEEEIMHNIEQKRINNEELHFEEKVMPIGDFSIWNAEECFPSDDKYCTLRLPKSIGINSNIKKKSSQEICESNGSDTDEDFGEHKWTYISWSFDEQRYLEDLKKKEMTQFSEKTSFLEEEKGKEVKENKNIKSELDKLYDKYENAGSGIFNNISEDCDENVKIICNNLKYFETNTFLVEYENGDHVLFIDNKPFLLEEEEESNYLIGNPQEPIKPILCHLKSNLNAKGMSMEDQPTAPKIGMKEKDIFYSLP